MQLPLELRLPLQASLQSYVAGPNTAVLESLYALLDEDHSAGVFSQHEKHHFLYLWGTRSTGKTHLLSGICELADEKNYSSIYLPLREIRQLSAEICEGLEQADIICIDDIDSIAGNPEWERALFSLYNRIRDNQKQLIVTSQVSPARLSIQLADLKSRLSWGLDFHLDSLDDNGKKAVLQQKAQNLGMQLNDECVRYLLHYQSRELDNLLSTLNHLDKASLVAKRKLTVPFIRSVLEKKAVPLD